MIDSNRQRRHTMIAEVVPSKNVKLSEVKSKDISKRRLFILVDGKKTLSELAKLSHLDINECKNLLKEMALEGYISADELFENEAPQKHSPLIECTGFSDCLTKELAIRIGPIAKILVDKTYANKSALTIEEMNKIIMQLAMEIENERDKESFINSMYNKVKSAT
jgi:hypothetical protein